MALFHIQFHSEALRMAASLDVIIPQKSSTLIGMETAAEEKCKTLYLLHGLSDDQTIWQRRTSIERYAAEKNLAVVMPAAGKSWYTDMAHGDAYQTYITKEVPAYCRSVFRCMSDKREDNFVAGLSMGGYGAVKTAFSFPERYGACISLSGALDVMTKDVDCDLSEWKSIFGPDINDAIELKGSQHDVYALTEKAKTEGKALPKLYMWCGTEDFLFETNCSFDRHLTSLGIPHKFETSEGNHSWKWWDLHIQDGLDWVLGD
jgi:putative tributyrin esterase